MHGSSAQSRHPAEWSERAERRRGKRRGRPAADIKHIAQGKLTPHYFSGVRSAASHTHQQLSLSNTRLEPASSRERALASSNLHEHFADRYDGESGVLAAALAGRVDQGIRRGLVRVQVGRERDGAAGDAGLRVRAGRGLRAGGHGRELPQPRLRGGALLLRRQQLLPAEQPDQGRHLRLRRHRHPLLRRPQLGNLQVPCKRKCCRDEHRERHGDRLGRRHQLFFPGLDQPSYARHGRELHHAHRQRVRPYGEHHRPREQRCSCRCGCFCCRPRPPRRCRGLRPCFLGAVLIMKQRET